MMNEIQAMRNMVLHPTIMKQIKLSVDQRKIFLIVKDYRVMTCRHLAEINNISIQGANQKLTALYGKGYFIRVKIQQDSGGYEYKYSPAISV